MECLKSCPACNSPSLKIFINAEDYFLSKEEFTIAECGECGLRFTNPRPGMIESIKYYDSADYISHDTSRKSLLTLFYTFARDYMLRKKFSTVNQYSKGKRILDIGSGTGNFLHYCKKQRLDTFGVELNQKAREAAIKNFGLDIRESISDYVPGDNGFDCITMWHVLEHIHDLKSTIELIKALLNPGGVLIIALPNCNSWDAIHYNKYWAAYDLPRHLYHFNEVSFKNLASCHQLKIVKIFPQIFDSFYISLLSEKYRTGRNNFLTSFINGVVSNWKARSEGMGYSSQIYILYPEIS